VQSILKTILAPFKSKSQKKRLAKHNLADPTTESKFISDKKREKISKTISERTVIVEAKTPTEGIAKMRKIIQEEPYSIPVFSPKLQRKVNQYISNSGDEARQEINELTKSILKRANEASMIISKSSLYAIDFPSSAEEVGEALEAAINKIEENTFCGSAKLSSILDEHFNIDNPVHMDFVIDLYTKLIKKDFAIEVPDKFKRKLLEKTEEHPETKEKYTKLIQLIESDVVPHAPDSGDVVHRHQSFR
jgi:flagellar biosynthesis GTPase FlhF